MIWGTSIPSSAETSSQDKSKSSPNVASRAKSWSSADFNFQSKLADPGGGHTGGWQEADAALTIIDARNMRTYSWVCDVTIGIPFRTATESIGPSYAASIAADVANTAADSVIDTQPIWIRGLFCPKFNKEMTKVFKEKYPAVGGRVQKCQ